MQGARPGPRQACTCTDRWRGRVHGAQGACTTRRRAQGADRLHTRPGCMCALAPQFIRIDSAERACVHER